MYDFCVRITMMRSMLSLHTWESNPIDVDGVLQKGLSTPIHIKRHIQSHIKRHTPTPPYRAHIHHAIPTKG